MDTYGQLTPGLTDIASLKWSSCPNKHYATRTNNPVSLQSCTATHWRCYEDFPVLHFYISKTFFCRTSSVDWSCRYKGAEIAGNIQHPIHMQYICYGTMYMRYIGYMRLGCCRTQNNLKRSKFCNQRLQKCILYLFSFSSLEPLS